MDTINFIREKQNELILMINSTFDELVREVEKINREEVDYEQEYETIYPITNTAGFKRKKTIGIVINNERKIASTWKSVVKTILQLVIEDEKMKNKVEALSDKLLGRVRRRLSSTAD